MKKKVRIYKAGGDTGAYINKTAQWMMQMGGAPDISQLGYPSQQQEQQEMSPDMLMNSVITDLSNQVPEQQIAFKLITIHKLDPVQAKQFINSVKSSLVDSEEEEEEEMTAPTNNSDDSLDDEENIIPEEEFETEEEAELVNEDTYEDVDDNQFAADLIMKYGGSKRNYVNSVLKLVKKQQGGDTKKDDADPIGEDVRDNMKKSFIGTLQNQSTLAKAKEQAEKEYEQLLQMQQQAPSLQYPMAQQGGQQPGPGDLNIYQGQDFENPMHHLALFSQSTGNIFDENQNQTMQAKFGMSVNPRMARKMQRLYNRLPMMGMNMNPISKVDVRRSGLFGRPKEYSVEFGANPLMQLASNPFLSSIYGYGTTTKTIKTPGRIGTEAKAKATNKKATEEVASQNTTDASKKSAQPTLEEMRAAATAAGDWGYTPPAPTMSEENVTAPAVTANTSYVKPQTAPITKGVGASVKPNMNKMFPSYGFDEGGLVNNPMSDPYGNLQRFIYGGNDIDQADIDDVYSKDTTDPYFQYGGLTEYQGDKEGSQTDQNCKPPFFTNCFPNKNTTNKIPEELQKELLEKLNPKNTSTDVDTDTDADTDYETRLAEEKKKWEQEYMQKQNPFGSTPNMLGNFGEQFGAYNPLTNNRLLSGMPQYAGSWDKTMRGPYDKRSGNQFAGMQGFNPNAQISNINVTKTGILGRPKKYSVTYNNNPTGKPEDRRLAGTAPSITTSKGTTADKQNIYSNTEGLSNKSQRQIKQGERKTAREVARGEEEFPETPDTTPRLGNLEYMQQAKNRNWSYQDTPKVGTQYYGPGLNANQVEKNEVNNKVNSTPAWVTDPSKAFMGKNQYGGLNKFLPQAEPGLETPVTQDDRFERLPIKSSQEVGQQLMMDSRKKLQDEANYEPDEYTVDYKRKDMFAGDLGEALPMVNAGLTGIASGIDKFRNKDREAARYENLNAENLYAVDPSRDRGDYDTNTGLYRAADMGQTWNSRSKQYGGSMDDYYENEEVDMTEEELADFLANGGEVEYL